MIHKILTGGQPGIERAAMDTAAGLGILHGGWALDKDLENLPEGSSLRPLGASDTPNPAERNIAEAGGTLIISSTGLSDHLVEVERLANALDRPFLRIDLTSTPAFKAATEITRWLDDCRIDVVYITGAREENSPEVHRQVKGILESVFNLEIIHEAMGFSPDRPPPMPTPWPATVNEAVRRLIDEMALKDRVTLANMTFSELNGLPASIKYYIRKEFGLWGDNTRLIESCKFVEKNSNIDPDRAVQVIIEELWENLRKTHRLRLM